MHERYLLQWNGREYAILDSRKGIYLAFYARELFNKARAHVNRLNNRFGV